jgi:hypothetical protein
MRGSSWLRGALIPSGRSLFFPIINNSWFTFSTDTDQSEGNARMQARCTDARIDVVSIDGVKVQNSLRFFTGVSGSRSPLFNAVVPSDNLFGLNAGDLTGPDAEQGYYLFVRPLPPGSHTIRWIASGCTPGGAQDVTYHLTVQR